MSTAGRRVRSGLFTLVAVAGLVRCGGATAEALTPGGDTRAEQALGQPAAVPGATRWLQHPRTSGHVEPLAVAQDPDRSVIVLADFNGTVDFGRGPADSGAGWAVALVRYDPDGRLLSVKSFASPSLERAPALSLAVDRQRNVVIAGTYRGRFDFGGGPVGAGTFIVKLDRSGRHLWSRTVASGAATFDVAQVVADLNGDLGVAGSLDGTVDLGGGPISGRSAPALLKLRADGGFAWAFVERSPGAMTGAAMDGQGNFYVCGGTDTAEGSFVQKLSAAGARLWVKRLGQLGGGPARVATHGDRVVVAGTFAQPLTFQGRRIDPDRQRAFVLAYSAAGQERWFRALGASGIGLAMDPRDGVTVLGTWLSGDDLGTGPLPGNPAFNVFALKVDRLDGRTRWVRAWNQDFYPVDVSASREVGEPVVLGSFSAGVTVDGRTLTPGAVPDLFLMKLAP